MWFMKQSDNTSNCPQPVTSTNNQQLLLPLLEPELLCLLVGVRCSPPGRVSRLVGVSVSGVAGSEPLLPGSLGESCGDDSIHTIENKLSQRSAVPKRVKVTDKVSRKPAERLRAAGEERLTGGCLVAPLSAVWRRRSRADREGGRRCGEQGCPPWRLRSAHNPQGTHTLQQFDLTLVLCVFLAREWISEDKYVFIFELLWKMSRLFFLFFFCVANANENTNFEWKFCPTNLHTKLHNDKIKSHFLEIIAN